MVGKKDLRQRTKEFALRIIKLVEALPIVVIPQSAIRIAPNGLRTLPHS